MNWMRIIVLTVVCCLSAGRSAYAHHLWVVKTGDYYVVARGLFPDRLDPYNPECVKNIKAFGPHGMAIGVHRISNQDQVRFQALDAVALVAVSCDWGHRVNTTKGKKLLPRRQAEHAGFRVISAFFSTQLTKCLFRDGVQTTKPIGMRFELVPLENPFNVTPGADLPLEVIFDRQPLVDIRLFTKEGGESRTDANGIGRITITKKGLQLIMAQHRVPVKGDPEKDYHLFSTFLVFEIK